MEKKRQICLHCQPQKDLSYVPFTTISPIKTEAKEAVQPLGKIVPKIAKLLGHRFGSPGSEDKINALPGQSS